MDRFEAQHGFWSSFGVPAYEENSVPELNKVKFPYITYTAYLAGFDQDVAARASIWTRSSSWAGAEALVDEIDARLRNGGAIVPYDGGVLWVTQLSPFAQGMGDPADDKIKRMVLSVLLHFC